MRVTPEMVKAVATLRQQASMARRYVNATAGEWALADAVEVLELAGVFDPIAPRDPAPQHEDRVRS